MPYTLVPNSVASDRATVWLAAFAENPRSAQAVLESSAGSVVVDQGWQDWPVAGQAPLLTYQHVTITGLQPRTSYQVRLRVGGQVQTTGMIKTLPDVLPPATDPFKVLLGSCFAVEEDPAGTVGRTYAGMPVSERPDVKFLCGDQVYLDVPPLPFSIIPRSEQDLQRRFFTKYWNTWTQSEVVGGFRELLANGANYFVSDDHEFWNNAPEPGMLVAANTLLPGRRQAWLRAARQLFDIFQTPDRVTIFNVGTLSFCLADTRYNRAPDRSALMTPADFARVETWLAHLTGPGVLVVGQPFFVGRTFGPRGKFFDWALSDYTQYEALLRALRSSPHSIVILSGDVHYGRIAQCNLNPVRGTQLIEVISSPLTLADPLAGGAWVPAPSEPLPRVSTVKNFADRVKPFPNHFLTLGFGAAGTGGVKMVVKYWPIDRQATRVVASDAFKTTLH